MVLFHSDKVPHEVIDTKASRLAIAGWYNRPMQAIDVADIASKSDKVRLYLLIASAVLITGGVASIVI